MNIGLLPLARRVTLPFEVPGGTIGFIVIMIVASVGATLLLRLIFGKLAEIGAERRSDKAYRQQLAYKQQGRAQGHTDGNAADRLLEFKAQDKSGRVMGAYKAGIALAILVQSGGTKAEVQAAFSKLNGWCKHCLGLQVDPPDLFLSDSDATTEQRDQMVRVLIGKLGELALQTEPDQAHWLLAGFLGTRFNQTSDEQEVKAKLAAELTELGGLMGRSEDFQAFLNGDQELPSPLKTASLPGSR